jgi:hypothetical protein
MNNVSSGIFRQDSREVMCSTAMRRRPNFLHTPQSLRECIMDKQGIIAKMRSIIFTDMSVLVCIYE